MCLLLLRPWVCVCLPAFLKEVVAFLQSPGKAVCIGASSISPPPNHGKAVLSSGNARQNCRENCVGGTGAAREVSLTVLQQD